MSSVSIMEQVAASSSDLLPIEKDGVALLAYYLPMIEPTQATLYWAGVQTWMPSIFWEYFPCPLQLNLKSIRWDLQTTNKSQVALNIS